MSTPVCHRFRPFALLVISLAFIARGEPLPATKPLETPGDLASQMVDGISRFLDAEHQRNALTRGRVWKEALSAPGGAAAFLETNRTTLTNILGLKDARVRPAAPEVVATTETSGVVASGGGVRVRNIRWGVFGDVHGEGLLVEPEAGVVAATVIALPDCAQTPAELCGLGGEIPEASRFPLKLARAGCRVIVPTLIDRNMGPHNGRARFSAREFLYRPAFEMGRALLGYEVQKVLALVDHYSAKGQKVGVFGYGEGALVALYAGAVDARIYSVGLSGYVAAGRKPWEEPIDRNVFRVRERFGDAELMAMIGAGKVMVEAARGPEITITGSGGAAPARTVSPVLASVAAEVTRAESLTQGNIPMVASGEGSGPFGSDAALAAFLKGLGVAKASVASAQPALREPLPNPAEAMARQVHELDRHTQKLLAESPYLRNEFMKGLQAKSVPQHEAAVENYRRIFRDEVIGRFDSPLMPANARSRVFLTTNAWTAYEVVLDVFPEVFAYGLLLLPNELKPGEKRPVVVCQHGLEGRPQDVVGAKGFDIYAGFAGALAEKGFITFAPQNPYIFQDRFRVLQRKANPLGKTLFSIIVPQHQQIVNWLKTLPQVDPSRIGFYGLSYGGKTAMRVPALVTDYCLSICSADFNEWVWKNASTLSPNSYTWMGEYEIFEFNLGGTFNYAEMAALIAPRPFMVERGHFDGVSTDEAVAYEYAKVQNLYQARLGIGDRAEIEWFVGPHKINGQRTYRFLEKHLNWPPER